MRANSLAVRLFVSATAWAVIILVITGVVLSSLYRQTVERAFDRRLGVYLRTIVADIAAPEEPGGKFPQSLGEPLFELPLSGWYWQVTRLDPGKHDVRSSRSLWDGGLPHLEDHGVPANPDGSREGYVPGPEDQRLRLVERITGSLAAIRAGTAERLAEDFPDEIAPLARETNALIEANKEIVERARTHVGNLAHALKTPISVMVNEAATRGADAFAEKVREQANIMRDQVARHLERAHLAARLTVVGSITDVAPVVTALARTMEKIHHDRGIAIEVDADANARFRGERPDLEEMIGNLVDNACKWATSRVAVEVVSEKSGQVLRIAVDDDGRGLSRSEREQVSHRGQRLDETKPGSGLGLSIVVELAHLYGGKLELGAAPIGGLRAELTLPAA